ncbi:C Tubulin-folding cofactor [Takifugu flavidus]|uniref:Tubulin-specific chaperone C n=1 Tax=Takifugu flavidus TaxID=433684 RepID=A0A5C6NUW2_9TELE|nr:C Tubulin-folding cofactor [Takifugu flavidus]
MHRARTTLVLRQSQRRKMDEVSGVSSAMEFSGESGAARVHERLQKRHQMRTDDAERRREAKESETVAEEKGEYFSAAFNAERASIDGLLSSCSGADRAAASERLEEATSRTLQLQKFLNDSVAFLTSYDLSRAQAALRELQTSLADTREECLPKKKFGFRARAKAADKAPAPVPDTPSPAPASKTAEEIQKRDVLLSHLTDCRVRLFGSPSTLHLKHIRGCEVLCGPVSSSVFVDQCSNSTLAFPCQQLRTHNTTDTRVYLHVTSRAIVEDCSGVAFAPFSWSYPSLDEDFTVSGLDKSRNNWNQVDDFNWLAAGTPSPNWTVIPEADRRTDWDL